MTLGLYHHTDLQCLFDFADIKRVRRRLNNIRTTDHEKHQSLRAVEDVGGEDNSGPCDHCTLGSVSSWRSGSIRESCVLCCVSAALFFNLDSEIFYSQTLRFYSRLRL